jgi:hypothetical protein
VKATTVGKQHATAQCETCGWQCGNGYVLAVASRHAEAHGHMVYVLLERGVYFDGTTLARS